MSEAYKGQDLNALAAQAERDLNSQSAKGAGFGASDTTADSGVDASATQKFPGAEVQIGSAASGTGDNRDIPLEEGGSIDPVTGKLSKARDFEGVGGPEDKAALFAEENPGDQSVGSNVRQGGETNRPPGQLSNSAAGGTGKSTQ
ncbi:hypothetical protein K431DRAFT_287349 [Polychaeton citri CBS 116435]|uniref:Uncharacterized protein n=1 Tax=Polychaeton citri CBS 116435 TaxID=1314669 RepID=A0A9P4Q2U5_9PEZI|nr:hypothetical protein K431DRAFT_287349 [Polychaeton citri CBS 116435]